MEVDTYHFYLEHQSSPLGFHHLLGVQLLHPPWPHNQTNKKHDSYRDSVLLSISQLKYKQETKL